MRTPPLYVMPSKWGLEILTQVVLLAADLCHVLRVEAVLMDSPTAPDPTLQAALVARKRTIYQGVTAVVLQSRQAIIWRDPWSCFWMEFFGLDGIDVT